MFSTRTSRPLAGNKYYITKSAGGYSPCIKGSPTDPDCNVLHNCVGYAVGRFNEIVDAGNCNLLASVDAGNMCVIAKQQGLTVSDKPTLGGCMVWSKTGGAGHVAVVEQINPNGSIITSESGYNSKSAFWLQTRNNDGNWGQSKDYKFLGCIINPACPVSAPEPEHVPSATLKKGARGEAVKWLQKRLYAAGYLRSSEVDGDFGKITLGAVCAFQLENGLEVDGIVGPKTKAKLVE